MQIAMCGCSCQPGNTRRQNHSPAAAAVDVGCWTSSPWAGMPAGLQPLGAAAGAAAVADTSVKVSWLRDSVDGVGVLLAHQVEGGADGALLFKHVHHLQAGGEDGRKAGQGVQQKPRHRRTS